MLDNEDACSGSLRWPSQLQQVGLLLKQTILSIDVQKLSGADPLPIQIDAEATLRDLKAAVSRAEARNSGFTPGLSLSLVLGEKLLREEFNTQKSRWKYLAEYNIEDGATLGLIQHKRLCNRTITIAVQELSGGLPFPIETTVEATLGDLKARISNQEGMGDKMLHLGVLGQEPFPYRSCGESLEELGIEDGMTLGWTTRKYLCDITNLQENAPCQQWRLPSGNSGGRPLQDLVEPPRATSAPLLLPAHLGPLEQRGVSQGCMGPTRKLEEEEVENTPKRSSRPRLERVLSACKESRSREVRAKKMLKRL